MLNYIYYYYHYYHYSYHYYHYRYHYYLLIHLLSILAYECEISEGCDTRQATAKITQQIS